MGLMSMTNSARTKWRSGLPARVQLAAWQFRGQRADYYEFMSQLLDQQGLEQTLLATFEQDHWRHGNACARGCLAGWWASRYAQCGGDLAQTWHKTLPQADLQRIAMAQQAGQSALVHTLASLARQIRLWQASMREFWQTAAVGMVALLVAAASLFVLPLWSVPRLSAAFGSVPADYHGPALRALVGWAAHVSRFGVLWFVLAGLGGAGLWLSVSHLTGRVRAVLDRFGIWRLYRDLQAMRWLSGTATLLDALSAQGVSLRAVLLAQQWQAGRWLTGHLAQMVERLDAGLDPLSSLDTGLLDGEVWWRFVDTVRVQGLSKGLGVATHVVGELLKRRLARRALVLRWLSLTVALAGVMAMGVWHLRAIDEFRQAMTMLYGLS